MIFTAQLNYKFFPLGGNIRRGRVKTARQARLYNRIGFARTKGVGRSRRGRESKKCSLVFNLKHESGSLLKTLKVLTDYKTNLTKIESRPVPGKMFEYFFYVDFEMKDWSEEKFNQLIQDFKKK